MKNSNLNNEFINDEVDLRELLRTIFNSKKLIIIITLASSLLAFIYSSQKESEYQSNVFIEIGSYELLSGEKKLVEPISSLIKKLRVDLVYKNKPKFGDLKINDKKLNFKSIEDQLLEINYTSPSPELNENVINQAIRITEESQVEILEDIINSFSMKIVAIDNEIAFMKNSFSEKIVAIDNKIEFMKNSIKKQRENDILNAIYAINHIDYKIPVLKNKIKYLLKLIPEEEENLLLLKSNSAALLQRASSSPTLQQLIYSYNEQILIVQNEIQNLEQEKDTLELQLKPIEEGEFASADLFKLQQEKDILEMQIKSIEEGKFTSKSAVLFKLKQEKDTLELQAKLIKKQTNMTRPIRELVTSEIKPNNIVTILIGTILGIIFSVLIVFIREAFLKEQN
jgi:LPS O-antigen subunit length determinant protein (WzzB/FepE family)